MSESVIDRLVVRLGLDSKPLNQAAPVAGQQLKKIEVQGDKTTASVNNLSGALASFLALIGGTAAIKHFIEDFIDANAALDRFSKNVNLSVSTISAWGNAVEGFGGKAQSAYGTIDMLSKAQTELRLTGESSLIPYLSALGVSLATVEGQAKPVDEILLDLADRFSKIDRVTANNMGRMMGIDQDTLNLLLQGRREVELTIKRQKENAAVTKEQAAEATKLQKSIVGLKQNFAAFGRDLIMAAAPALEKIIAALTDLSNWVRTNAEFVKDFLTVLAVGLGAIAVASLPLTGTVAIIGALAAAITLLWQDYQTWKRGGDSLIDWEKWEPGIKAATAGIEWLGKKASQTLGILQSVAGVWKNGLSGNTAAAADAAGVAENKVRSMLGMKPANFGPSAVNTPETISPERAKAYFMSRGMPAAEASGLASQIHSESSGRTNAEGDYVNGKATAYGLLQWHKGRQGDFAAFAGHDIRQSTGTEQLAFMVHELTQGKERSAGRALSGATSAYAAGDLASRLYVRPGDVEGEATRRGKFAALLNGVNGASGMVAGAGPGSAGGGVDNSKRIQIDTITIHTAATDADGIAEDLGDSLNDLMTANANTGLN